jgi:hypothetical protein
MERIIMAFMGVVVKYNPCSANIVRLELRKNKCASEKIHEA